MITRGKMRLANSPAFLQPDTTFSSPSNCGSVLHRFFFSHGITADLRSGSLRALTLVAIHANRRVIGIPVDAAVTVVRTGLIGMR